MVLVVGDARYATVQSEAVPPRPPLPRPDICDAHEVLMDALLCLDPIPDQMIFHSCADELLP